MDEISQRSRTIAAFYFCLLSLVATAFVQLIFYSIHMSDLLPLGMSLILSVVVSYPLGALFGKSIVLAKPPYKMKCFFLGVLYFLTCLVIYDLALIFLLRDHHPELYSPGIKAHAILYLFMLVYSSILVGSWLCILSGLAAIYLRHSFVGKLQKFHNKKHQQK